MLEGFSIAADNYVLKQIAVLGLSIVVPEGSSQPEAWPYSLTLRNLPREVRRRLEAEAQKRVNNDVFGVDHKTDRKTGSPIEQGKGSWAQPSRQSIEAYKKYHGPSRENPAGEPGYAENIALMEERLKEFQQQQQKAKRDADGDDA